MSIEEAGKSRHGWDLIVLPGGAEGATELRKSMVLMELLRRQNADNKFYAAIGCSPAIVLATFEHLAPPGATCSPLVRFRAKMVEPSDYDIVIQKNLVTSQGAGSALLFALQLGEMLFCKESADNVAHALLVDREGKMRYTYSRSTTETAEETESPSKDDVNKKLALGIDILERLDKWRQVQTGQNVDQHTQTYEHSRCMSPTDDTKPAALKQKLDWERTLKQQKTNIESNGETIAENSTARYLISSENVKQIDDVQENIEPKASRESRRNSNRKKLPVSYEEPLDVDSDDNFNTMPLAKNLKRFEQYLSGIVKTKSPSSKFKSKSRSRSDSKDPIANTTTSLHYVLEKSHFSCPMEIEIAELIAVENCNEWTNWKKIKAKASQELKTLIEEKEQMGLDHGYSAYTLLPEARRMAVKALVLGLRKRRKTENSLLTKKSESIESAVGSSSEKDAASRSLANVGNQSGWQGDVRLQKKARLNSETPLNIDTANVIPSHFRPLLTNEKHGKLPIPVNSIHPALSDERTESASFYTQSGIADLQSDYTVSSNSSPVLGNSERVNIRTDIFVDVVWPVLENLGWRVEIGSRPTDKYFFPPGIARERNKMRVDYFDAISQVLKQISEQKPWNESEDIILAIHLYSQKTLHTRKQDKREKKFVSSGQRVGNPHLNGQQKKRPNTKVELSTAEMAELLALHNKREIGPKKRRKSPLVQSPRPNDVHPSSEVFDVNEISCGKRGKL